MAYPIDREPMKRAVPYLQKSRRIYDRFRRRATDIRMYLLFKNRYRNETYVRRDWARFCFYTYRIANNRCFVVTDQKRSHNIS